MKRTIFLCMIITLLAAACTAAPTANPAPQESPSPIPTTAETAVSAGEDKVKIYYEENAQVELISPGGTRVLIDIASPTFLSSPAREGDILLTTHSHGDHVNANFLTSFPGQQLYIKTGTVNLTDWTIQGISSGHNAADAFQPEGGTNYIFLIETAGLRIVHFGDIGQDALTEDQLSTLGKVDIAITQFNNSYSDMNMENLKGFNLMDQVKPRLIIPTHVDMAAVKYAARKWPALYSTQKSVSISRSDLTDEPRILFLGMLAPSYGALTNAAQVDW